MTPAQALAAREEALLNAPSSPAAAEPTSAARLTAREREVLHLLTQGLTNPQIARRLVISPVTVNAHVRSIYDKLAVTSRSAATRYALLHQIV
jgi:DNA-binding NarL/FixJ family response regulator